MPTAANMRRSCRFQPWRRVPRYHVNGPGAGWISASSRRVSVMVAGRRWPTLAIPSSSVMPPSIAWRWSGLSGPPETDRVLALDAVARMQDAVGPRPVVRQQQQAFRIEVEAADRVEPGRVGPQRGRHQVQDRPRGVAVPDRRRDTDWLVQDEVQAPRRLADPPAVDGHLGQRRIDLLADLGHATVDRDSSCRDQRVASPARRHAGGGKNLLQTLDGHRLTRPQRRRPARPRPRPRPTNPPRPRPANPPPARPAAVAASVRPRLLPSRLFDLGRGVHVQWRELHQAGESEALQELEPGAVEVRPAGRLGTAKLNHEASVEQGADGVVGVDAADSLDAGPGDRLAVRHDRQRFEGGLAEAGHGFGADVASDQLAGVGCRGKLDPLAAADEADAPGCETDLEVAEARVDDGRVDPRQRADLPARQRPLGDEEQGLEGGLGQLARSLGWQAVLGLGDAARQGPIRVEARARLDPVGRLEVLGRPEAVGRVEVLSPGRCLRRPSARSRCGLR